MADHHSVNHSHSPPTPVPPSFFLLMTPCRCGSHLACHLSYAAKPSIDKSII